MPPGLDGLDGGANREKGCEHTRLEPVGSAGWEIRLKWVGHAFSSLTPAAASKLQAVQGPKMWHLVKALEAARGERVYARLGTARA